MNEIKGVAFDVEGTTINLEPGHHSAHLETARKLGITLTLEEAIRTIPNFIGGPDIAVAKGIHSLLPFPTVTPEEILEGINGLFSEYLRSAEIVPRSGLIKFLDELRSNETPIALGSATSRDQAMLYIERSGLRPYFEDMMVLGEDLIQQKPAPDVYLTTARLMSINATGQLVFEDSPRGVRAGVAAGSTVVGMPVYYDNPDVLKSLCVAGASNMFRSWGEVSIGSLQQVGIEIRGRSI